MTPDQANTILAGLTAAFPNVRLEEDTPDVWRKHLAPLHYDVSERAVTQCVANLKFFPSIAEFREFYRLERHNSPPRREPEPPARVNEVPEWVAVWWWAKHELADPRTFPQLEAAASDRQLTREWREMSGTTYPATIESAPPKPGEDYMAIEEYEAIREGWVAAGSPRVNADQVLTTGATA